MENGYLETMKMGMMIDGEVRVVGFWKMICMVWPVVVV